MLESRKATGSGTSTGSGTGKAYSYSVNTTAGFSIIKFTKVSSGSFTFGHGLGVAPHTIIAKRTEVILLTGLFI